MSRKAKAEAAVQKKPLVLGTKRACPKCGTKFYDFEKREADCPKCGAHIDFTQQTATRPASPPPAPKKAKPKATEDDEEGGKPSNSDEFESLDDLGSDDDEVVVESLDVDGDDDDEEDY